MLEMNQKTEQNNELNQVLKDVGNTLSNELQKMFQKDPSSVINVLDDLRGSQSMPAGFASADQLLGDKSEYNNASSLLSPAPDYNFGQSYAPETQAPQMVINIFEGPAAAGNNMQAAPSDMANAQANVLANQMSDKAVHANANKIPQSHHDAFGLMDYLKSGGKLLGQLEQNFSNPNGDPLAGVGDILKGAFGKSGTGAEVGGILGSVVNSLDKSFSPNYHQSISQAASGNSNAGGAGGLGNLFNSFAGQAGGLENIAGNLGNQFSSIGDTATSFLSDAAGQIGDVASGAGDIAGEAAGAVGDFAGDAASAVGDLAGTAADGIGELAGEVAPALFSLI